jgi:uncharacterized protein (DUF433 family)
MTAISALVTTSPDVMWGAPVFAGTRVLAQALFDYVEGGHTLDEFLADFPTVTRAQALDVLEWAKGVVLGQAAAA